MNFLVQHRIPTDVPKQYHNAVNFYFSVLLYVAFKRMFAGSYIPRLNILLRQMTEKHLYILILAFFPTANVQMFQIHLKAFDPQLQTRCLKCAG